MGNYCSRWRHCFKGLSLDGGRVDLSLCDASFNKDLSNQPTFGRIHLWTVPLKVVCNENEGGGEGDQTLEINLGQWQSIFFCLFNLN